MNKGGRIMFLGSYFRSRSLKGLLLMIVFTTTAFWLASFVYSSLNVRRLTKISQKIDEKDRVILRSTEDTLTNLAKIKENLLMATLTREEKFLNEIRSDIDLALKNISQTVKMAREMNEKDVLKNAQILSEHLNKIKNDINLYQEKLLNAKVNMPAEIDKILKNIGDREIEARALAKKMLENRWGKMDESFNIQAAIGNSIITNNSIIFVIAVLLAIIVAYMSGESLRKEAKALVTVMKNIEQKDFTKKAETRDKSNNEIHIIGKYLNTSIDNTTEILKEIQNGIEQIASASEEFSSIAEQVASHSTETFADIKKLISYTESLNEKINLVSRSVEELSIAINEISKNTSETSQEATLTNEKVLESNNLIDQLIKEIDQIKIAANIIQNIADQTNLLALNATIEAARAGEHGKGFAVVANEVKELSRETSNSTKNIREWVDSLVTRGTQLKDNTDNLMNTMKLTVERASSIATAIEEQTAMTDEISKNTAIIAQEVDNISKMTEGLKRRTEEAERSISGIQQAANDLSRLANSLREMTLSYRI